jgi:hypothetical protein
MCHGLHPYAVRINQRVRDLNLFITEANGTKTAIQEFDVIHILLGEMKPVSLTNPSNRGLSESTKGGHWLYTDAKVGTHAIGEITILDRGYFDLGVKHIRSSDQANMKTFFPYGSTPDECFDFIIDAIEYTIKHPNKLEVLDSKEIDKKIFQVINQYNDKFKLYIEKGTGKGHPLA